MQHQSLFKILSKLCTQPKQAFDHIWQYPRAWFPWLILTVLSVACLYVYANTLDFEWYRNFYIENFFQDRSPLEIETLRKTLNDSAIYWQFVLVSFFLPLFSLLFYSIYFFIVGKLFRIDLDFSEWFALSAWSSLPLGIGWLMGALRALIVQPVQIPYEALNPFSLKIFGLESEHKVLEQLYLLSIDQLWVLGLLGLGFHLWSKKSLLLSYIIVTFPLFMSLFGVELIWDLFS